jgi:hypothetical protein
VAKYERYFVGRYKNSRRMVSYPGTRRGRPPNSSAYRKDPILLCTPPMPLPSFVFPSPLSVTWLRLGCNQTGTQLNGRNLSRATEPPLQPPQHWRRQSRRDIAVYCSRETMNASPFLSVCKAPTTSLFVALRASTPLSTIQHGPKYINFRLCFPCVRVTSRRFHYIRYTAWNGRTDELEGIFKVAVVT